MAMCGNHSEVLGLMEHAARHWRRLFVLGLTAVSVIWATPAGAAETVNAYSIWPENWARPMLQEFETATGIKVNFLRFSSGEALARVLAEKNNPKVDVLFGGPVETFAAGIKEQGSSSLTSRQRRRCCRRGSRGRWLLDRDRRRSAGVHDQPEVPRREQALQPPASWDDLLNPAYKSMLQMADARTSGTAVTRIFSILR